ncbi:MAG: site-specific DNA-methyltransferase [Mesoflavibacter sp.]|nr:site-specific DNA-methyltransferase [Mesoflavibacter sp.]
MILNKVHHKDFLNNDLPDKCAKLIIADPPYFKVKGEFDFIWKTFEDYLVDVEKWCLECKRILADNGTLLWYGDAKNIAYAQIIFDKHFNLINNLTWNKGSFMGLEESEGLRSFAPCTERILMYSNMNDYQDNQLYIEPMINIRNYLNNERKKARLTLDEMCAFCGLNDKGHGGIAYHWCSSKQPTMIPEKHYKTLQGTGFFKKAYSELRKEYEDLRKEYEELRRPFNNQFNLQEVLNFSNEQAKTGAKYDHDTVKPEKLTRALILTCSRKNDLIVVPFVGSGTECAMSAKEKRPFIGYEITEKHAKMAQDRVNKILNTLTLF